MDLSRVVRVDQTLQFLQFIVQQLALTEFEPILGSQVMGCLFNGRASTVSNSLTRACKCLRKLNSHRLSNACGQGIEL
eukprot:m.7348 g.7348  ORF g.7348 m.7348 type:complete len:78 (+) comp8804_c0_seq1:1194-1427(+)